MAANLIVQRPSDHQKVLNVTAGSGGVGIQLQQQQARPPPPPRPPPRPQPQHFQHHQPAHHQAAHHPPAVNEEELLDTMNEFANPLKKGGGGGGGGEFLGDMMDDDGEEEFEDDEDDEGGEEGRSEGLSEGGDGDGPPPAMHMPAPAEQPGEGYNSIEEERSDIIFKLERLHRQGVKGIRSYTPFSNIQEMRTELSRVRTELELERSVKFQRKILMGIVSALEWGNTKLNPFDLELEGWSETMHQSVQQNIEYDGVFEELYFKYRGKMSTPPEIRLMLMVGGSAMMFHMTKSMMKSALPNMGAILQQNPQMMEAIFKGFAPPQQPQQPQQQPQQQPGDQQRREMRGPGGGLGLDLGGLAGGLDLGSLAGGLAAGFPGMPGPSVPPPPAMLNPMNTGRDRGAAAPPPPPRSLSGSESERLSDVVSDDLNSLPDDFSGSESGSEAGAKRISLTPAAGGRRAKRPRTVGAAAKKVITL